ncbi:uncharacterized protein LOC143422350 [Xylocopa sonorina]|uniref:uncharacterized protein LOC143422350 n=1 Tax=Xylocopa sonorina TaxID=1818115 RepID=UPI00403A8C04
MHPITDSSTRIVLFGYFTCGESQRLRRKNFPRVSLIELSRHYLKRSRFARGGRKVGIKGCRIDVCTGPRLPNRGWKIFVGAASILCSRGEREENAARKWDINFEISI